MANRLTIAKEGKKGKISIIGDIGWDYFGISYKSFKAQLADLGNVDTIDVDITSPGGIVTDGVAIMNALVSHPATVNTIINGQAASIASVIAMAGDTISIYDNSLMFVHKPLNVVFGNANDMEKMAKDLDKFETAMLAAYKRHFKKKDEDMKALMASETWLTADEVAEYFDNVTIIPSGEAKAAAHGEPLAVFGNPDEYSEEMLASLAGKDESSDEFLKECLKDNRFKGFLKGIVAQFRKQEPKATQQQEDDMPLSKEEKAELVSDITASVVAALKPAAVQPAAPAPEAIAFEGDMDKPEDVLAHAEKLRKTQIKASVNWNDPESVLAYHKTIAPPEAKGSNTQPAIDAPLKPANAALTPEALAAEVAAVNKHRGIKQ